MVERPLGTADRGQSPIDFVVGFGVFFLAFTFVVVLLPELLSPFAGQGGSAVADRATDTLTGELLASGTVGTLNETCTDEFFAASGGSCPSFDGGDPTPSILGIPDEYSVNVTVERPLSGGASSEVVCYNGTDVLHCSNGGDPLARGVSPPDGSRSVRTASRVVRIDGETLLLRVRVW